MDWKRYAKALVPGASGLAVLVVDKLVVDDTIEDAVWQTLLGAALAVFVTPNKEETAPKEPVWKEPV